LKMVMRDKIFGGDGFVGKPADKKVKYLTKSKLVERGWTESAIKTFLHEADLEKCNPVFRSASPMKLYLEDRVLGVEATKEFCVWVMGSAKRRISSRKSVETKKKKVLDEYEDYQVEVPRMSRGELFRRAVEHYNTMKADRYECFDRVNVRVDDPQDKPFLDRIAVNYLRHEMTDYEDQVDSTAGKISKEDVIYLIRSRIYEAIAKEYLFLRGECNLQLEKRRKEAPVIVFK
jgi:hypothetical protein